MKRFLIELYGRDMNFKFDYDPAMVETLKEEVKGRKWSPATKSWNAPFDFPTVTSITNYAESQNFKVEYGKNLEEFIAKQQAVKVPEVGPPLSEFGLTPFPHQIEAIERIQANKFTFINDQMGLGKTLEAILGVATSFRQPRVAVVCPAVARLTWVREINRVTGQRCDVSMPSSITKRFAAWIEATYKGTIVTTANFPGRPNWNLVSYETLTSADLDAVGIFDAIIIDESHYVKNEDSARTKAAKELVRKCTADHSKIILLTGTPVLNRPEELIPQLDIGTILGPVFGGKWGFYSQFIKRQANRWGYEITGYQNLDKLVHDLSEYRVARHLSDVIESMPERIDTPVVISPASESWVEQYQRIIQEYAEGQSESGSILGMLSKASRVLGEAKAPAAVKYIEEMSEDSDDQMLIFAHHKKVIEYLSESLKAPYISGDTSVTDRQVLQDEFQEGKHKYLILGIKAASTAITLTAARQVVFVELSWVPGDHDQAVARAYGRMNDLHQVMVHWMFVPQTLDEDVYHAIVRKENLISDIMNGTKRLKGLWK